MQQDFDAAQAKLDALDYAGARTAFTALLTRFPPGSTGKAASLVRARLGNALIATNDSEAAVPMLEAALVGLKPTTPAEAELAALARHDLGRAEDSLGELDLAARHYRAAIDLKAFPADSPTDIGFRASLARTLIWSDPAEARRLLDALLALPPTQLTGDPRALVMTLRGRVELNNGDPAGAKRWFTSAAAKAGGANTSKVSIADVRIRGDLALANILVGNMVEAQRYVALSGAGALLSEGLAIAAERPLPSCAPASGIAPDAVAVVEFGIAPDGRTYGITPIYASRGSGTPSGDDRPEIAFPKAVLDWSWTPEQMAKLDPFWRQAVRVEMRCQMPGNNSNAVLASFTPDFTAWKTSLSIEPLPAMPGRGAAVLPKLNAELARREGQYGPQSPQLVPVLMALAHSSATSVKEGWGYFDRYHALMVANNAPVSELTLVNISEMDAQLDAPDRKSFLAARREGLLKLLAGLETAGHGTSRIAMYVRLLIAEGDDELQNGAARKTLETIVAAPESLLPAGDPIRIAALLRISNQAAAARDTVTAASALAATGLAPEQCALIDVKPQAINRTVSTRDFPSEAQRWSSEGFVLIGYDITAEGVPANVRTVLALPPFAFSSSTEKAVARFRFQPVFRPGNTIGCSGATQPVRFRVQ